MSMSLMAKAMNIKVGNPIRKLVLIKLADNANDKGECWPSYQHIADHCECSKTAVRNHIEALERVGMLVREHRIGTNNGKGNASNVYYLKLDTPMPSGGIPPIAGNGTPMPSGGIPPMPSGGTRTSHSFEPVIEPKTPLPPTGGISPEPAGEKQDPKPEQPAKQDYQAALEVYNDTVADRLPHAVELNDKRRRGIKRLIGQLARKDLEGFRAYVAAFVTNAPPFYFGDNDRGWTANLDYLLRADTLTKVREGTL
ncbi:hypothetical protein SME13J_03900 [Serratia marcescens]|nr:hypothetical protein SME13J_03900 [Serratia marcescens]